MLTKIEWVGHSVNPIRVKDGKVWPHGYHCTKVSPGCAHCYAEKLNMIRGTGLPFDDRKVEFYLDLSVFDNLPKNKAVTVFVQSMGDIFHEGISDDQITAVYDRTYVPAAAYNHRFLILTKRPERALGWYQKQEFNENYHPTFIWLGVTAENQDMLEQRWYYLRQIPAAVRFISMEPLIGGIDMSPALRCEQWEVDNKIVSEKPTVDWVIVGAESGPKRRECKIEWVRDIVGQCKAAGVPAFIKQLHINGRLSKNPAEWPEDLRVREWPG